MVTAVDVLMAAVVLLDVGSSSRRLQVQIQIQMQIQIQIQILAQILRRILRQYTQNIAPRFLCWDNYIVAIRCSVVACGASSGESSPDPLTEILKANTPTTNINADTGTDPYTASAPASSKHSS